MIATFLALLAHIMPPQCTSKKVYSGASVTVTIICPIDDSKVM